MERDREDQVGKYDGGVLDDTVRRNMDKKEKR